ncbi:MAG: hypothetical protein COU90_01125 [Candidatus Ryanbacteria bacterium CG10_big_fil_rev_8_21_14_0_10_43_42]|uniref:Uncharacterized protein n=1 Tax=Candidatus Ryanbacteria bacterium CG10_big_fil_rev_8_21_14_0_10_43_42 TaxID=1974864 RepID=A0A2M8KY43_9BACT|nr:MAG: hypothetical protein COU90_01125 [Candidatus Ryanbacteria bacterium CG10_big_fil_rev_8_21_14_0_10_43_42]
MENAKKAFSAIGAIIVLLTCIYLFVNHQRGIGEKYSSDTDRFVFIRDVEKHAGTLTPASIIDDTKTLRLTDIFSDANKSRYGADTRPPDGVGLIVSFIWRNNGTRLREETFRIPVWNHSEQPSNARRREFVDESERKFDQLVQEFVKPVAVRYPYVLVLDTTNGGDNIAPGVQHTIDTMLSLKDAGHTVPFRIHFITGTIYQGDYFIADNVTKEALEEGMNRGRKKPVEDQSFVFSSLRSVLRNLDAGTTVEIYTDGTENSPPPGINLYKSSQLLDESNWKKLDDYFSLEGLTLDGVTIRLHPMKLDDYKKSLLQDKALQYIASRLKLTGAEVSIEL